MKMIAIVFACLACTGHGRQVEPSKSQLAELLLALHPEAAFSPSSPGMNRRELMARAAAAGLAGLSAAQAANAKAGQFSQLDIFSPGYTKTASMPYIEGGPTTGNEESGISYGYKTAEGTALAKGFRKEVKEEKAAFAVSEAIFRDLAENVKAKNWFVVKDQMRDQGYTFRTSMKSISSYGTANPKAAIKEYEKFWGKWQLVEGAILQKDPARAQTKYAEALAQLDTWKKTVGI